MMLFRPTTRTILFRHLGPSVFGLCLCYFLIRNDDFSFLSRASMKSKHDSSIIGTVSAVSYTKINSEAKSHRKSTTTAPTKRGSARIESSNFTTDRDIHWLITQKALLLLNRNEVYLNSSHGKNVTLTENVEYSSGSSMSSIHRDLQYDEEGYSDDIRSDVPSSEYLFNQCDISLLNCFDSLLCAQCYSDMQQSQIDWANVATSTSCEVLMQVLTKEKGLCEDLHTNDDSQQLFCQTFRSCVDTQSATTQQEDNNGDIIDVDCISLTECTWPGIRAGYIGNGVCNDNLVGCYNSPACQYDGGDCCSDTCQSASSYLECGHEPYVCRDPNSASCDNRLSYFGCNNRNNSFPVSTSAPKPLSCESSSVDGSGQTLFKLVMYDSFGDGWGTTEIQIKDSTSKEVIFSGGLVDGEVGEEYICLSTSTKTCYDVSVSGGVWGREISWEVRLAKNRGAPSIATGGSPMSCSFSIWGNGPEAPCPNTCTGRTSIDPVLDPNYVDFKNMFHCIEDKCQLQTAACKADSNCIKCYQEDVPDSCYTLDTFIAVSDCSTCKCANSNSTDYCINKATPGAVIPNVPFDENTYEAKPCTPTEIYQGGAAMVNFGTCSSLNATPLLLTTLDQNRFGALDRFEACAHAYSSRGTNTALGCLQILANAALGLGLDEGSGEGDQDVPVVAISALASNIYLHGEMFCDCAKEASFSCPLCPSFTNFKILLYEILDACNALDEIDCDAWNDYSKSCRNNVVTKFGEDKVTDYGMNGDVCAYIEEGCGGSGAYPASFRRLDCETEISPTSWNFYLTFRQKCLLYDEPASPPIEIQKTPSPTAATSSREINDDIFEISNDDFETEKGLVPKDSEIISSTSKAPYIPPEQRSSVSGNTQETQVEITTVNTKVKRRSHWFRNFVIISIFCCLGFYIYKKRTNDFAFVRYRRMGPHTLYPSYDYDFDDTTNGFAMTSSSRSTFQPPPYSASP